MAMKRYYAECTDLDPIFNSKFATGWQVFDRHQTTAQGATLSIAFCSSRATAFAIRDALNKEENDARSLAV